MLRRARGNPTGECGDFPFHRHRYAGLLARMLPYDRRLKVPSRRLRRDMTDAEQRIWHRLRRKQLGGVQFYRQKPLGRYIVDFHAPAARLGWNWTARST